MTWHLELCTFSEFYCRVVNSIIQYSRHSKIGNKIRIVLLSV